jgi:hypothetical protein
MAAMIVTNSYAIVTPEQWSAVRKAALEAAAGVYAINSPGPYFGRCVIIQQTIGM